MISLVLAVLLVFITLLIEFRSYAHPIAIVAGVVFIPMHFAEAAANLLTIEALDPLAKIPEYKACAVRIVPAKKEELARPDTKVVRGRY